MYLGRSPPAQQLIDRYFGTLSFGGYKSPFIPINYLQTLIPEFISEEEAAHPTPRAALYTSPCPTKALRWLDDAPGFITATSRSMTELLDLDELSFSFDGLSDIDDDATRPEAHSPGGKRPREEEKSTDEASPPPATKKPRRILTLPGLEFDDAEFDDDSMDASGGTLPTSAVENAVMLRRTTTTTAEDDEQDRDALPQELADRGPYRVDLARRESVMLRCTFAWLGGRNDEWFRRGTWDGGEVVAAQDWAVLVCPTLAPTGYNYVIGVGPYARYLTSPFLEYTAVVVPVVEDSVVFDLRGHNQTPENTPRLFYVEQLVGVTSVVNYNVLNYSDALRFLVDTLYAHVETCGSALARTGFVREALRQTTQFEVLASATSNYSKTTPLNRISGRDARRAVLRERFVVPCVVSHNTRTGTTSRRANMCLLHPADLGASQLFTRDLPFRGVDECIARRGPLLDACVGVDLAHGSPPAWATVTDRAAYLDAVTAALLAPTGCVGDVALLAPLDLAWYDSYMNWRETHLQDTTPATPPWPRDSSADVDPTRTARLDVRAAFVLSHAWRDYVEKRNRWGALVVFPFTRAQQRLYFGEEDSDDCAYVERSVLATLKLLSTQPALAARMHLDVRHVALPSVRVQLDPFTGRVRHAVLLEASAECALTGVADIVAQTTVRWAAARQERTLPLRYQERPPLAVLRVSQCGPDARESVKNIAAEIRKDRLRDRPQGEVAIVGPESDLRTVLLREPKDDAKAVVMLIVRDGHRWSLARWASLAKLLAKQRNQFTQLTNLVVFVHPNTLSPAGTLNIVHDLVAVGRQMDTLLGNDGQRTRGVDFDAAHEPTLWERMRYGAGDLSAVLYPVIERIAHLDAHEKQMAFLAHDDAATRVAPLATLFATIEKRYAKGGRVLVLYTFGATKRRWINVFKATSGGTREASEREDARTRLLSYREFERGHDRVGNDYEVIVLVDVENASAWSHLTYHHVNAALERAQTQVFVVATKDLFRDLFLKNSVKTDRVHRQELEVPLVADKLRAWLDARGSRLFSVV